MLQSELIADLQQFLVLRFPGLSNAEALEISGVLEQLINQKVVKNMQTFNSFSDSIQALVPPMDQKNTALALCQYGGAIAGIDYSRSYGRASKFYLAQVLRLLVLLCADAELDLHDVAREGIPSTVRYRELSLEFLFYQQQAGKHPRDTLAAALRLCAAIGEVASAVVNVDFDKTDNLVFQSLVKTLQCLAQYCTATDIDLSAIAQAEVDRLRSGVADLLGGSN